MRVFRLQCGGARRFVWLGSVLLGMSMVALLPSARAGSIVTDGSVGPVQTLTGPEFLIPQSLGKVVGENLFLSFRSFGLDQGQSALFRASVAGNVITRVTGGGLQKFTVP